MNCSSCSALVGATTVVTSGRTAVSGCVVGIVHVLADMEQAENITNGEILVTAMTNPECTPAILRAAAVVTDRGGMLCHAAIVCREQRKPCIVGTKNATTALRDGMRVRVCATRGVVEVLE